MKDNYILMYCHAVIDQQYKQTLYGYIYAAVIDVRLNVVIYKYITFGQNKYPNTSKTNSHQPSVTGQ